MANVISVAKYILENLGSTSTMKLQKLVYYSQAHSLVYQSTPLFEDSIEAWANGPVVPNLYHTHRGQFVISDGHFDMFENLPLLTAKELESINAALYCFGEFTGEQLSDLTHSEAPWKDARLGLAPTDRGHSEITQESIASYYSQPTCINPLFVQ